MRYLLPLLLLSITGCCSDKKEEQRRVADAMIDAVISPAQLAAMEKALLAEAKANQSKKCPRPLLRGRPLAGSADRALLAIIKKGDAALEGCFKFLSARDREIRKFLKAPESRISPSLEKIIQSCEPLALTVASAARHREACSPFLTGRRALPNMIRFMRMAKGLSLLVRGLLQEGKAEKAINLALDGLRVSQDLSRGRGTPLIVAMVAVAASKIIGDFALRVVLNSGKPLGRPLLQRLQRELKILVRTEPPFREFLASETQSLALQTWLPLLKGPGWVPPGGWDEGLAPGVPKGTPSPKARLSAILGWVAMKRSIERLEQACPQGSTMQFCHQGMTREGRQMARAARAGGLDMIIEILGADDPAKRITEWIIRIFQALNGNAYAKYIIRYAYRSFYYAAHGLHAALRLEAERTGHNPPLKALLAHGRRLRFLDPNTGLPLGLSRALNGAVVVSPSRGFSERSSQNHKYEALRYLIQFTSPAP